MPSCEECELVRVCTSTRTGCLTPAEAKNIMEMAELIEDIDYKAEYKPLDACGNLAQFKKKQP